METDKIFEIMDKFTASGLGEMSLEHQGTRLSLKKQCACTGSAAASSVQSAPHLVPGHVPAGPAAAPATATGSRGELITSPIVGTYFAAPAPDAPNFVEAGSEVAEGETLCILEAMKQMNRLDAEFPLVIEEILVKNGAMVEFGTPLFRVVRK